MMKTIDKYQLFAEIQKGPVTTLYKAYQKDLDRVVLIKRLNDERSGDGELRERFRQEALILAKLNHPNIIEIFDIGDDDGVPYLVMEFINGYTLTEIINDNETIPIDIALYILNQIACGINTLHAKNYIHRDIKPDNIMISFDGIIKLGDFGFAEHIVDASGWIVGTPSYMAPELISKGMYDKKSDVFSFGVVFYELLSGKNPFYDDDKSIVFSRILGMNPISLAKSRNDITSTIARLCTGLIDKDFSKRLDLKTVIDELRTLSEGIVQDDMMSFLEEPSTYNRKIVTEESKSATVKRRNKKYIVGIPAFLILFALLFYLGFHKDSSFVEQNSMKQDRGGERDSVLNKETAIKTSMAENAIDSLRESIVKRNDDSFEAVNITDTVEEKAYTDSVIEAKSLIITTDPRAWILVSGDSVGISPVLFRLKPDQSSISIDLLTPGFPRIGREIDLSKFEGDTIHIDLWDKIGYLLVYVKPWGEIWVDNDSLDTTPLMKPILTTTGLHKLEIKHPGFERYEDTIYVSAGDTLKRFINLINSN